MTWPEAVSDGLELPCANCDLLVSFDYRVTDEFWDIWGVGTNVLCLPCLDGRCHGEGLADSLIEVQWTGTGHTVVLTPSLRHEYATGADTHPEKENQHG